MDSDILIISDMDDVDYHGMFLPSFTLYDHPKDFPDKIVMRIFDLDRPTNVVMLFDSIEEARAAMPRWLSVMPRAHSDDPVIIETYL
jgi:hypothetical protein